MLSPEGPRHISVVNAEELDQGSVEEYIAHHPESTVYHTLAWRKIFSGSFGYRSWWLAAITPENKGIVGILPVLLVRSPFSCRLVSVPFRDRGGALWSSPEAFLVLVRHAQGLAAENGARFLQLKHIRPYPAELVQACGLRESWYWINSTVDLRGLDREILWKKIGQKTRNMIRQAEQAQLTFREVTDESDGLITWYGLHLETQQRLGIPPFPLRFFRNMLQELRPARAVKLFLVAGKQAPLAATIVLLHHRTAIYGYSSSATQAQLWRPNDFMLFNVFQWLLEHGYEEFDLGSDAPSQSGLLFFKRKWLARQAQIPVYSSGNYNPVLSDSSDPKYLPLRQIMSHTPIPLLRLLGNMVTKFFG